VNALSKPGDRVTVLTIAGSDPSGGAGIQADLQVFASLGAHGAAAVTALTVQDTRGVQEVWECPAGWVRKQVAAVLEDLPVGAVKIGMLAGPEVVLAVTSVLAAHRGPPVVLDPVRTAGSGAELLNEAGLTALRESLLPLAHLVTPNLAEAEALAGRRVRTIEEMRAAARAIAALGPAAVLVKGGHLGGAPVDVLFADGEWVELPGERVALDRRVHGTGCAFSAAAAVFLANGSPLVEAVSGAKRYVTAGLRAARAVGHGALVIDYRAAGAAVGSA